MRTEINILAEQNIALTLKEGIGLKYGYNTWIVAKDTKRKKVLVGGLGGMGVGQMWFEETPEHSTYPGYKDAPEEDSWVSWADTYANIDTPYPSHKEV